MRRARLMTVLWLVLLASVGASAARADDLEAAKAHYKAGESYYDQASYADALKEFQEAYRLSGRPALLYNVARCMEQLGRFDDAITALEKYLRADPKAKDRVTIEQRIVNLKARRDEQRARAAAPASPATAPTSPTSPASPASPASPPAAVATAEQPAPASDVAAHEPPAPAAQDASPAPGTPPVGVVEAAPRPEPKRSVGRRRVATWVIGGLGLGLLAGAVVSGAIAQSRYSSLENECPGDVCTDPAYRTRVDAGRKAALATDILWPVGAACVIVGTVLYFFEGKPKADKRAALSFDGSGLRVAF